MSEKNNFLYDVSMSYVNAGWQERYCALVKYLDAYLKENCGEFFADLQLYQTGPMNYVVVHASSEEMEESEDEQPREDYASSTGEEIRQERNDTTS